MSKPTILSNVATQMELTNILSRNEHNNKLCVVMFTANWCGPCQNIKREIYNDSKESGLSTSLSDVSFFYVDIDNNGVASEFKIEAVPAFYFFTVKNGELEVLHPHVKGGNKVKLAEAIGDSLKQLRN